MPKVKLEHAKKQWATLQEQIGQFINTGPFKVSVKRREDTRPVYYVSQAQDVPIEISLLLGDVLHNLNASLDLLAYAEFKKKNPDKESRDVYFKIPEDNAPLIALRKLDNRDKHRNIVTTGSAFQSFNVGHHMSKLISEHIPGFPGISLEMQPSEPFFPLSVGDELFIDGPGAQVITEKMFTFSISIHEPEILEVADLGNFINEVINEVEKQHALFSGHA